MTTTQKQFDDHITQRLREAAGHDQISAAQNDDGTWSVTTPAGMHRLSTTGLHHFRLMLSASKEPTCRG